MPTGTIIVDVPESAEGAGVGAGTAPPRTPALPAPARGRPATRPRLLATLHPAASVWLSPATRALRRRPGVQPPSGRLRPTATPAARRRHSNLVGPRATAPGTAPGGLRPTPTPAARRHRPPRTRTPQRRDKHRGPWPPPQPGAPSRPRPPARPGGPPHHGDPCGPLPRPSTVAPPPREARGTPGTRAQAALRAAPRRGRGGRPTGPYAPTCARSHSRPWR